MYTPTEEAQRITETFYQIQKQYELGDCRKTLLLNKNNTGVCKATTANWGTTHQTISDDKILIYINQEKASASFTCPSSKMRVANNSLYEIDSFNCSFQGKNVTIFSKNSTSGSGMMNQDYGLKLIEYEPEIKAPVLTPPLELEEIQHILQIQEFQPFHDFLSSEEGWWTTRIGSPSITVIILFIAIQVYRKCRQKQQTTLYPEWDSLVVDPSKHLPASISIKI